MIRSLIPVLMLLGGAAPLVAQQDTPAADGCYELSLGPWSQAWPSEWHPPHLFQLSTQPAQRLGVTHSDGSFAVRPDVPFPRGRGGGGSSWERIGTDSILIHWVGDYAGLELRLELDDEVLNGWIRGYTDVVRDAEEEPRATAEARPAACPDEPFAWLGPSARNASHVR